MPVAFATVSDTWECARVWVTLAGIRQELGRVSEALMTAVLRSGFEVQRAAACALFILLRRYLLRKRFRLRTVSPHVLSLLRRHINFIVWLAGSSGCYRGFVPYTRPTVLLALALALRYLLHHGVTEV